MSYHDDLERALLYAPAELFDTSGGMVAENGSVTYTNKMDHTQRLGDSAKIKVNFDYTTPLNSVSVEYPEDLDNLLRAAVDVVGGVDNYDFENTVIHEEGHAEVFRRSMGATACRFEVQMMKWADTQADLEAGRLRVYFRPSTQAPNIVTPKIILASMYARPVDPSDDDNSAIESCGYQGVQDVGDRLIRYSRRQRSVKPIFLPLSYIEPR